MKPRDAYVRLQIKPDGVQRGLVADIIRRFEQKGYALVAIGASFTPPHQHACWQLYMHRACGLQGGRRGSREGGTVDQPSVDDRISVWVVLQVLVPTEDLAGKH